MAGFSIKRPDEKRRTFSIHIKTYTDEGAKYERLNDERLDSINANLKSKLLSVKQAELQLKELVARLKTEQGMSDYRGMVRANINQQNLAAYEKYFKAEYEDKKLVRLQTVENEFLYALRALSDKSLYTIDRSTLQKFCDKTFDAKQHCRYVSRINALLDFIGRGFRLHLKPKPNNDDIMYVEYHELEKILEYVEDENLRNLYVTLYCTGARTGEAFAFNPRLLKPNGSVFINRQMDNRDLSIREIKNKKPHHTIILKQGLKAYKDWAAVEDKAQYRKWACSARLAEAARKAYPNDPSKHISPHDLRHSFVIDLLSKGVSIDRCARLIGDTVAATEKAYAGFNMKNQEIEDVKRILGSKAA